MDEGKVVKVLSNMEVVVNLGASHGVHEGTRFVIFQLGEDLVDPDTKQSLGRLELVRGRGEARHVQDRMSTIRSIETKRALRDRVQKSPLAILPSVETVEVEVQAPFEGVKEGDLARKL